MQCVIAVSSQSKERQETRKTFGLHGLRGGLAWPTVAIPHLGCRGSAHLGHWVIVHSTDDVKQTKRSPCDLPIDGHGFGPVRKQVCVLFGKHFGFRTKDGDR